MHERIVQPLFQCSEETWCRSVLTVEEIGVSLQQGLSRSALSSARLPQTDCQHRSNGQYLVV